MLIVQAILLTLAAVGHLVLWTSLVNRLHGTGLPHRIVDVLALVCWTLMLVIFAAVVLGYTAGVGPWVSLLYLVPCVLLAVHSIGRRLYVLLWGNEPAVLLSNHTRTVDVAEVLGDRPVGDRQTEWLARLPGNELFQLRVQRKELAIRRLPQRLDGLSIVHLSDLHMSGRIRREYYDQVVEMANAEQADMIVITGDLFDTESCIDWGSRLLGELHAQGGVYFIFGNHDRRVDHVRARHELSHAGLIDLGGRWREIRWCGERIVLAGNELPWFGSAGRQADENEADQSRPLRVLLSHAPDQIEWARDHDFDLMLAGHTHGGQICFPVVGAVVTPSRLGTQYASGTFDVPPTVLHVSRGVASLCPVRWNCPPELAVLVLRDGRNL